MWKRLRHPNIVPNLGVGPDIAAFCVVSPWMQGGDLLQYLANNPGANRVSIVSVHVAYHGGQRVDFARKMIGVADGLAYLHFSDVIHGDFKGVSHIRHTGSILLTLICQMNILFDSAGVPQIADFGVASITFRPTINASTPSNSYTLRWAAPEILEARNEDRRATKMSDVYAFAMVVIEVKSDHRFR